MSCKKCVFQPVSIEEKRGVTTITLEDGVLSTLCNDECYGISLNTSIPNTARCNRVVVTDGTIEDDVYKCNQYWRPSQLPCGCTMLLIKKTDPSLSIFARYC